MMSKLSLLFYELICFDWTRLRKRISDQESGRKCWAEIGGMDVGDYT